MPVVSRHGERGLHVGGGAQADGAGSEELAHVHAVLLASVDDDPGELEIRVVQQLADHQLPDEPRSPDDHTVGHPVRL